MGPRTLRRIRKERGLTQKAMAALYGVHPITVAQWETGLKRMGRRTKQRIEERLQGVCS